MECKDCKYRFKTSESFVSSICKISHICNTVRCDIISDEDIENMHICFNCEHWLGGGDWGLSCRRNYYNCNSNGFAEACEEFIRKKAII